jgi:hypothetical protein
VPSTSIDREEGVRRLEDLGLDESRIRMVSIGGWIDAQRIWLTTGVRVPDRRVIFDLTDLDAYAAQLGGA